MDKVGIRQRIHDYVDQADDRFLTLVKGMIDTDIEQDWWDTTSPDIQASINRAIDQSEKGEGRSHEKVMEEIRLKYLK
ncbi:MAG: hypothetical protein R8G66_22465 [Cytophagales bacterium]|nr:hypothetical protein [Cytophagales bacterium]